MPLVQTAGEAEQGSSSITSTTEPLITPGGSLVAVRWKRCAGRRVLRNRTMNRTEAHPIEVLLLVALLALEAAVTVAFALVALFLIPI